MDPEMSDMKKRTRSFNIRKRADKYYLAIRAYKVIQLKDQIKGYIMKSCSLEKIVDICLSNFHFFRPLLFQISAIILRYSYCPRICNYDYLYTCWGLRPKKVATTKLNNNLNLKHNFQKPKRVIVTSLFKTLAQALLDLYYLRL